MIIGPASTTVTNVDNNGYVTVANVAEFQVGITLWLNAAGQDPMNCIITEVNRTASMVWQEY